MLKNLRLWAKIMAAMGLSIVVVVLMSTIASLRVLDTVIDQAERNQLDGHVRAVSQRIATDSRMAEALAALVAAIPVVQDRFAAGDRAGLAAQMLPPFTALSDRFGIDQFQFHTPPATSFLRLHMLAKFGDDLSGFRPTVVAANRTGQPIRGLEGGVAGLGIRGVVPVDDHGRHVGSVEFGLTIGQAFFESIKAQQGVDVALLLVDGDRVTTFASTMGSGPVMPAAVLRAAFAGAGQVVHRTVAGTPRAISVTALTDYSGKPIGVLEIAMDRSATLKALADARTSAALVALAALAVGLMLALLTARHLTTRISAVMHGVRQVAIGNLAEPIRGGGGDELGRLAAAAEEMRRQLHTLATQVRAHAAAVHAAACEIVGAVEGQAASSSQMSASVAEITSTMEELSASSTQIAEHSRSVVDIANVTWESSKKGSDAMQEVTARMGDIQEDNGSSLREILELGRRSKEISKVMTIINTIADQTKLIAFNAALEAASAGEAGRRFGVVAAEIRRLADSVTESTGEIETRVGEIQDTIGRLVVTSEKGGHSIETGMAATDTTAGRLGALVDAAHQTSRNAQQISLSTQQQKTASAQVVMALREIVTASSHTAQSLARINDISRDMSRLSGELDAMIGQFRLEDAAAG